MQGIRVIAATAVAVCVGTAELHVDFGAVAGGISKIARGSCCAFAGQYYPRQGAHAKKRLPIAPVMQNAMYD